jgi:hypothetical protein
MGHASRDAFRFDDGRVDVYNSESSQPMSLTNDVRDEIKAAKKLRVPGWAIVCVMVVTFLCIQICKRFGKPDLVLPIMNSIGVLGRVAQPLIFSF